MILSSLTIYKSYSGNEYNATVKFTGGSAEVALNLDTEISRKVLEVVAQQIADAGIEVAKNIKADILTTIAQPELLENHQNDDI